MILPMNHQFYPYYRQVIPFSQRGKGDKSIFGGTHPYGQGGNGLGGMFRSLFRTATPFLKTTAKKVGKRLLNTGLDRGMQIAQDVLNGQSVKKAAKSRDKAASKSFLSGAVKDITQQGRGRKVLKRKRKAVPVSSRETKKRKTSTAKFRTIFD